MLVVWFTHVQKFSKNLCVWRKQIHIDVCTYHYPIAINVPSHVLPKANMHDLETFVLQGPTFLALICTQL